MPLHAEPMGRFATLPLAFGRDGDALDTAQIDALLARLAGGTATPAPTDLLVLSHGWNNDEQEAHALYAELLGNLDRQAALAPLPAGRRLDVLLVYWPSKRFADLDLMPGGAASIDTSSVDSAIDSLLGQLIDAFTGPGRDDPELVQLFQQLRTLAPRLDDDPVAQDDFVRLLRSAMSAGANDEEPVLDDAFFTSDGAELLFRLGRRFTPQGQAAGGAAGVPELDAGAGAGGAAFLGNRFQGLKNGAYNLLNLFTYYEMKARAGQVGSQGLADVLRRVRLARPELRLHLCGHSFGARLVSAALAGLPPAGAAPGVCSLTLLQAAFSHWSFAKKYDGSHDGFFRAAFESGRLAGPALVTHTRNDQAVGLAYPLASRLRNQVASGLGDENDPYGGLGRNGAQKTPEVQATEQRLRGADEPYGPLLGGGIYNLEASAHVSGHGDVRNPAVAHALWAAVRALP